MAIPKGTSTLGGNSNGNGGGGFTSGYAKRLCTAVVYQDKQNKDGTYAGYVEIEVEGQKFNSRFYFSDPYDADGNMSPEFEDYIAMKNGEKAGKGDTILAIKISEMNRIALSADPAAFGVSTSAEIAAVLEEGYDLTQIEGYELGVGFLGFLRAEDGGRLTEEQEAAAKATKILYPQFPVGKPWNNKQFPDVTRTFVPFDQVDKFNANTPPTQPEDLRVIPQVSASTGGTGQGSTGRKPPVRRPATRAGAGRTA